MAKKKDEVMEDEMLTTTNAEEFYPDISGTADEEKLEAKMSDVGTGPEDSDVIPVPEDTDIPEVPHVSEKFDDVALLKSAFMYAISRLMTPTEVSQLIKLFPGIL